MKHQIILLGKDITSSYHGIKEFGPDMVHLIYTKETKEVMKPMLPLLPDSIQYRLYLVEAYTAESIIATCRKIHQDYAGDFFYNLSEGTKLMAFAAFTVAKEYKALSFYMTQLGDLINLETFEMRPMSSILDNEEIVALNGAKLSSYYNANNLTENDIRSSLNIKRFIEQYPEEHGRLQKFFDSHANRRLSLLPETRTFSNKLRFVQEDGTLLITLRERILLNIPYPSGCTLYFEGRWWETLVASKVKEWSNRQTSLPEVWQSVVFHTENNNQRTKNEVDILLNNEQKLIFIECKSGHVTQNDVYKVDAVRETYGGDISEAILTSYFPVESSLREKCRDLQINLFAPAHFADRIYHLDMLPNWLDTFVDKIQI